jgi:hypothetical protein
MIYLDLLLVALVTVYIVDISGFTDSWRSLVATKLHISRLRPLPPFDCGKCATWWSCLIYSICVGEFSLATVAFSAAMSLLSIPIGQLLIFVREGMTWLINKIIP